MKKAYSGGCEEISPPTQIPATGSTEHFKEITGALRSVVGPENAPAFFFFFFFFFSDRGRDRCSGERARAAAAYSSCAPRPGSRPPGCARRVFSVEGTFSKRDPRRGGFAAAADSRGVLPRQLRRPTPAHKAAGSPSLESGLGAQAAHHVCRRPRSRPHHFPPANRKTARTFCASMPGVSPPRRRVGPATLYRRSRSIRHPRLSSARGATST